MRRFETPDEADWAADTNSRSRGPGVTISTARRACVIVSSRSQPIIPRTLATADLTGLRCDAHELVLRLLIAGFVPCLVPLAPGDRPSGRSRSVSFRRWQPKRF